MRQQQRIKLKTQDSNNHPQHNQNRKYILILNNSGFRINNAKNDLRKHHFDLGGQSGLMMTTH